MNYSIKFTFPILIYNLIDRILFIKFILYLKSFMMDIHILILHVIMNLILSFIFKYLQDSQAKILFKFFY